MMKIGFLYDNSPSLPFISLSLFLIFCIYLILSVYPPVSVSVFTFIFLNPLTVSACVCACVHAFFLSSAIALLTYSMSTIHLFSQTLGITVFWSDQTSSVGLGSAVKFARLTCLGRDGWMGVVFVGGELGAIGVGGGRSVMLKVGQTWYDDDNYCGRGECGYEDLVVMMMMIWTSCGSGGGGKWRCGGI